MNSLQCCTTTQSLPWPSTTSVSFSKWSGSCVGYWNTPRAISGWGEPTCLRCKRRGVGVKVGDVIKWEANWDVHLWYLSVMWGFLRGFVSFGYANTTVSTHRLERKKKKKITDAHTRHIKCDKLQWKVMKKHEEGETGLPSLIFMDSWWILWLHYPHGFGRKTDCNFCKSNGG